jgi:hypothetical protein
MSSATGKPSGLYAFYKRQNIFFKVLLFCPFVLYFLFICVIGSPILILGLYAYADLVVGALFTKITMARNQRATSLKTLDEKLASGTQCGTFIFEAYTLGWGVGRVWWTADVIPIGDAPIVSAPDPEADANPHQQWIYDTYADLKKGKALLLIAWTRKNTLAKLQRLFPAVPHVTIWSAAIAMKRRIELRKQT